MIWALISNGVVINMIVWDGEATWSPGPGLEAVPATEGVQVGWTWDGEGFAAPEAA